MSMIKNEKFMEKVILLMQKDDSFDAPKGSLDFAKNIFRAKAVQPKKTVIEKIFAVLQIDLSQATPAFGERSASAARQMLFQAGDNAIDLRLAKSANGFGLKGQILGEGFANCEVKLGSFETNANELSEFTLTDIPAATYRLSLKSEEKEVVIEFVVIS